MDNIRAELHLIAKRLGAIENELNLDSIRSLNCRADKRGRERRRGIDWIKFLSSVSSIGITLVGLLYAIGFFIVNAYFSHYGNYTLSLVESQYLAAGVLFMIVVGVVVVPEIMFTRGVDAHNWRMTVGISSATGLFVLLSFVIADPEWLNALSASIPLVLLMIGTNVVSILYHGWQWDTKVVVRPVRSETGISVLFILILLVAFGFLYSFSRMTYPLVKPEFGGGYPQQVQFYGNTEEFKSLELYGVTLTTTVHADTFLADGVVGSRYTSPLYLLGETRTSYIVTDTKLTSLGLRGILSGGRGGVSFQIPKEAVAGVLYLVNHEDLNPLVAVACSVVFFVVALWTARLALKILWPTVTKSDSGKRLG